MEEKQPSHALGYSLLALCIVFIAFELKTCDSGISLSSMDMPSIRVSDGPDTLEVKWDIEKSHIYKMDKIGEYLYREPWNPKGFVISMPLYTEDKYGNTVREDGSFSHYKVSKRFQAEAKKFASADFYRWKTWTSEEPGTFGTFIDCMEQYNSHLDKDGVCNCSYLMPD